MVWFGNLDVSKLVKQKVLFQNIISNGKKKKWERVREREYNIFFIIWIYDISQL